MSCRSCRPSSPSPRSLDSPVNGRIFFEQVHPRQPRHRPPRPGGPDLRPPHRPARAPRATPGRFRTRVITDGRHPEPAHRLQELQDQAVPQTRQGNSEPKPRSTSTNDFGVGKAADQPSRAEGDRLHRQPAPPGRPADQPRPDRRRRRGLAPVTRPVITPAGTRIAGMRFTDPRVQALLHALCVFRLLPHGFTNADLRTHLAPLLGITPDHDQRADHATTCEDSANTASSSASPEPSAIRSPTPGCAQARYLTRVHDRLSAHRPGRDHRPQPASTHPRCAPPTVPTRPPSTTSPGRQASPPEPFPA